jgi:general secretion pathway protein D
MSKTSGNVPSRVWPLAAALLAAAALTGCVTTNALRQARHAEQIQDYDVAVAQYTKALRAHPQDEEARLGLTRARLRASEAHYLRGRQLFGAGKYEDAVVELQLAAELNPTSPTIDKDLRAARASLRAQLAVDHGGQTTLEALLTRTRLMPPAGLALPDVKLSSSITTGPQVTSRDVYRMIARLANLNVIFDPTFRDVPAAVNLSDLTVRQALDAVAGATATFYRVSGANTITVIPDTPAKRREYQEEMVQTFYLEHADLKETMDLLRVVADTRAISPVTGTNAIAIRDTPERLQAVGKLLSAIDKARPEVVIDVEILEVDRTKLLEYGAQFASPGSPGIDGTAGVNYSTLKSLSSLSQSDVIIAGLPALYYRLLKTDTNTRTLANPHIRTSDGLPASAKFGDRVPVPNGTFAPIAQGGVSQQAITSYVYENVGVNIDITPRTHPSDDVTLTVKLVLSSVSGTGYNGLPTFANREINTTIRLKDGETNILAGLIRDDERVTLDGIPGLSDIPVIGRMFAKSHREKTETDIILTLTPHIISVLDLTEADLRPFRVLRDSAIGGDAAVGPMLPSGEIIKGGTPPVTPATPVVPKGGGRGGHGPVR